MIERINQYKNILDKATESIKNDLIDYFKKIDYNIDNGEIQIMRLNSESDIDALYAGSGFYVILTDTNFNNNKCSFSFNNQTAIYRGHSYFSRKRIASHLSNDSYKLNRKKSELNYVVCLKIEEGINGININQEPYCNWQWTVIIHKMKKSSQLMREQAELAFDFVYGKPCKSRES